MTPLDRAGFPIVASPALSRSASPICGARRSRIWGGDAQRAGNREVAPGGQTVGEENIARACCSQSWRTTMAPAHEPSFDR